MFDWSRGSLLKAMQLAKIPDAAYDPWLKGFAYAWLQSILAFSPQAKVLDVGCSATPHYAEKLRRLYSVEAHGLDKGAPGSKEGWGLDERSQRMYPEVILHHGWAGEEVCPPDFFDAVISVSTLEHIYDTSKPVDANDMYPHYRSLKDMARMVKPGGVVAFTYDFPLSYPYNPGWSPIADYEYLLTLGLSPCCPQKTPQTDIVIYNHSDSLFVQPDGILAFCDYYFRIAIMCFAFRKSGETDSKVQYRPNERIRHILEGMPEQFKVVPLLHHDPEAPLFSRLRSNLKSLTPTAIHNAYRYAKSRL